MGAINISLIHLSLQVDKWKLLKQTTHGIEQLTLSKTTSEFKAQEIFNIEVKVGTSTRCFVLRYKSCVLYRSL